MERYDVVVLGTGAAGLTAAVVAAEGGASVAVFEKADQVGGTTAWSGGQVWIPNNPHMAEVGVADSRERAIEYIMSLSRDMLEPDLVEAYVDAGPDMVELLEAKTPVQFYAVAGMPDYHPEHPGGSPGGGRTIECPIYPFDELGEWADRVTPSPVLPRSAHHDERDAARQGRPRATLGRGVGPAADPQRAWLWTVVDRAAAACLPRSWHRAAYVIAGASR